MTFQPAKTAIRKLITENFTAIPASRHSYPNDDQFKLPSPPAHWLRVEVQGTENRVHSVGSPGNRLFLHDGIAWLHVFAPFGTGEDEAGAFADQLGTLLQRRDIPAPTVPQIVRTEDPSVNPGERDSENGNWYRISVSVPFQFFYFA